MTYTIDTPAFGYTAERRYSDFEWLRDQLIKEFPLCYLHPLGEKRLIRSFERDYVLARLQTLRYFMESLLGNR